MLDILNFRKRQKPALPAAAMFLNRYGLNAQRFATVVDRMRKRWERMCREWVS